MSEIFHVFSHVDNDGDVSAEVVSNQLRFGFNFSSKNKKDNGWWIINKKGTIMENGDFPDEFLENLKILFK